MVDGDTWYVPIRSAVLSYKPRFVHNLPDAHTTREAATAAVANGCKTITPKRKYMRDHDAKHNI